MRMIKFENQDRRMESINRCLKEYDIKDLKDTRSICLGKGVDGLGKDALRCTVCRTSSVPAHVEMMGLIGMGNNLMVGCSVAAAVAVSQGLSK